MTVFRVGQKVACAVDGTWADPFTGAFVGQPAFPSRDDGQTYVVSAVETHNYPTTGRIEMLRFHGFAGVSFAAECFRPVVERKTDISIFTQMLNQAPAPQRVRAELEN